MSSQSAEVTTALAFLSSFDNMDMKANVAFRSEKCTHSMLPLTLGYKQGMTNKEFLGHATTIGSVISRFPLTPLEVHESGRQVVVHVKGVAYFKKECHDDDESVQGYWRDGFENEYLFMFVFDQEGKIEKILEFLNSAAVSAIQPVLAQAFANMQKGMN